MMPLGRRERVILCAGLRPFPLQMTAYMQARLVAAACAGARQACDRLVTEIENLSIAALNSLTCH